MFNVNTSGYPFPRKFKLQTLVRDSSIEQKLGFVSAAKVHIKCELAKGLRLVFLLQPVF